jgi:hypothetical protein
MYSIKDRNRELKFQQLILSIEGGGCLRLLKCDAWEA